MTSKQIKTELDQTTKRLNELTQMREHLNNNLQTLQQGFVDGKVSLDELQAEQGRLTTLNDSIKSLEAKQSELQTAFKKASLSESRQELLESATKTALEAETLFKESLEIRDELDNAIGELAEKFCDKLSSFYAKQKEYLKLRAQFEQNTGTPGISDELVRMLERNHINFRPVKFGMSIGSAYQTIAIAKEKEEIAKSRAV